MGHRIYAVLCHLKVTWTMLHPSASLPNAAGSSAAACPARGRARERAELAEVTWLLQLSKELSPHTPNIVLSGSSAVGDVTRVQPRDVCLSLSLSLYVWCLHISTECQQSATCLYCADLVFAGMTDDSGRWKVAQLGGKQRVPKYFDLPLNHL